MDFLKKNWHILALLIVTGTSLTFINLIYKPPLRDGQVGNGKETLPPKSTRVDYTKLRDLLKAKKWKEADTETLPFMLQAADLTSQGYLTEKDIESFPCEDLHIINQLWLEESGNKFGFSVQKEIYQNLIQNNTLDKEGGWLSEENLTFGVLVGWRKEPRLKEPREKALGWTSYDKLTWTLDLARDGHLPTGGLVGWSIPFSSLEQRLKTCNL